MPYANSAQSGLLNCVNCGVFDDKILAAGLAALIVLGIFAIYRPIGN